MVKIIIALIVILILGAVVFFGVTGAVLPWFVTQSVQPVATLRALFFQSSLEKGFIVKIII